FVSLLLIFIHFAFAPSLHLSVYVCFHDPSTTQLYTLSLHDALPILTSFMRSTNEIEPSGFSWTRSPDGSISFEPSGDRVQLNPEDRKSTRLNSSHVKISYAVFCLKKKIKTLAEYPRRLNAADVQMRA